MAKLTRDKYAPYIDLTKGAEPGVYQWERVRKSTIFELSANAQEDTYGYIDTQNDTTEVTSYQPQLPLETITESTDKVFAFMQKYLFDFPMGSDTIVPFMLVYPIIKEDGSIDDKYENAIVFDEAVVSNLALNTVDQQATWTEMLNGTPKHGYVAIGTTEFKEGDAPATASLSAEGRKIAKAE